MSPVVVTIGWILCIPSVLGVAFAVLIALGSLLSESTLETTIGLGVAVFFGILSLVAGLIGYLLIMKKKVFRCTYCGYIIDRA